MKIKFNFLILLLVLVIVQIIGCGKGSDILAHLGVCDNYPEETTSLNILPYQSGSGFVVAQGNCTSTSHSGNDRYAYDFIMPIGTDILAIRGGTVIEVEESFLDGSPCPDNNFLKVQHVDGTVAAYVHLTQNGALVNVGDSVTQGQSIARSGNTGCSTGPHLHLVLLKNSTDYDSLPITFSNTRDHPDGLQASEVYTAN